MAPTNKAKKPTKRRKTLLTKRRYNREIKLQVIHMHQTGKSNEQIIQYLKENWNIEDDPNTDVSVDGIIEDAVKDDRGKALYESYRAVLNIGLTGGIQYMTVEDRRHLADIQDQLRHKFV